MCHNFRSFTKCDARTVSATRNSSVASEDDVNLWTRAAELLTAWRQAVFLLGLHNSMFRPYQAHRGGASRVSLEQELWKRTKTFRWHFLLLAIIQSQFGHTSCCQKSLSPNIGLHIPAETFSRNLAPEITSVALTT